jgi:hypothetical protein
MAKIVIYVISICFLRAERGEFQIHFLFLLIFFSGFGLSGLANFSTKFLVLLLHSTLTHYVTIQVAMKSSYDTISIVLAKVGVGLFKKLVTHLISRFYVDLNQV